MSRNTLPESQEWGKKRKQERDPQCWGPKAPKEVEMREEDDPRFGLSRRPPALTKIHGARCDRKIEQLPQRLRHPQAEVSPRREARKRRDLTPFPRSRQRRFRSCFPYPLLSLSFLRFTTLLPFSLILFLLRFLG